MVAQHVTDDLNLDVLEVEAVEQLAGLPGIEQREILRLRHDGFGAKSARCRLSQAGDDFFRRLIPRALARSSMDLVLAGPAARVANEKFEAVLVECAVIE